MTRRSVRLGGLGGLVATACLCSACGHRESKPLPADPLRLQGHVEAGGAGVVGWLDRTSGLTVELRPGRAFGVVLVVRNRTKEPIEITRVASAGNPVELRLIGVRLRPAPRQHCPKGTFGCPAVGYFSRPLGRTSPPRPLALAPGGEGAVQLDFEMLPCGVAHPRLPERGNRFLDVAYRRRDGRSGRQRLAARHASVTLVASTGLTRC